MCPTPLGGVLTQRWVKLKNNDVCLDDLLEDGDDCLVYSFAQRLVRKEKEGGEFERAIARLGCAGSTVLSLLLLLLL